MEIINLCENNSLVGHFMSEIRDKEIQQDRLRFRANVHRLGQIMAYEISKRLNYKTIDTVTHDAGVVAGAAKNKVEELTGRDLDGDGVVGAPEPKEGEEAAPDILGEATKAAADIATGAKNKVETLLNKDLDGDGKIG